MPTPEEMKFFETLLTVEKDNSAFLLWIMARLTVMQDQLLQLASATASPQDAKEIERRVTEELERLQIAHDAARLELPRDWTLGRKKEP